MSLYILWHILFLSHVARNLADDTSTLCSKAPIEHGDREKCVHRLICLVPCQHQRDYHTGRLGS